MSDAGDFDYDDMAGGDGFEDGDFDGDEGIHLDDDNGSASGGDDRSGGGGSDDEDDLEERLREFASGGAEATDSVNRPVKITYLEGSDRRTINFMTKYEYTMAIGYRAHQIENGAKVLSEVQEKHRDLTHSLDIAKYELDHFQASFPNFILRPIFDDPKRKVYEKWYIPELIIPRDLLCITRGEITLNSNCGNTKRAEFDTKALEFASLRHYT